MQDDRLFNPRGLRHYRRTYSMTEFRAGLAVLAGLGAVGAWVAYRGGHPDPSLFANTPDLLDPGNKEQARGALPAGLAPDGFREGKVSRFAPDDLYKKINGRADFFLARGFVELTFVSLVGEKDASLSVDVEFYDMGTPENALGAYAGEKAEGASTESRDGSTWHFEKNALFVARGRNYARGIGSADSAEVRAALEHVLARLVASLGAGERPWALELFETLDVGANDVGYHKQDAFSFEFAKGVYSAPSGAGDTEIFVMLAPDAAAAEATAAKFVDGFASLGERVRLGKETWAKDEYLSSLSTARADGRVVFGVRGATDPKAAASTLSKLAAAVGELRGSDE
ncbi:MAG TPA: DUF6599 family protein [Polyangiaceae bacterium]